MTAPVSRAPTGAIPESPTVPESAPEPVAAAVGPGDHEPRGLDALVLTEDGTLRTERLPPDSRARLDALQDLLGGRVDVVRLDTDLDMWIHEDSLFISGPSAAATAVAAAHGFTRQRYFGPVVLTGGADTDGATVGLTPEVAVLVAALAQHADSYDPYDRDADDPEDPS